MVDTAREVAKKSPSYLAIAYACGVSRASIHTWMANAKAGNGTDLENQLLDAIHGGLGQAEQYLTKKLFDGDTKDAAWLLTHSPFFRDEWSDAAAARREVQKAMTNVAQAIETSTLSPEQRLELFTRLGAVGVEPPSVED